MSPLAGGITTAPSSTRPTRRPIRNRPRGSPAREGAHYFVIPAAQSSGAGISKPASFAASTIKMPARLSIAAASSLRPLSL